MRIEQSIRLLEALNSIDEIRDSLASMTKHAPYAWSCLLIKSLDVNYVGNIPLPLTHQMGEFDIKRYHLQHYRPQWYTGQDEHLAAQGVPRNTLIIPIKTLGLEAASIMLGINEDAANIHTIEKISWYWQILSTYIYDAYKRCHSSTTLHIQLTKRERECLNWAAEGKTSWEISQILKISERTVNFHLGNCIEKTNSVNRQQAISKCLILGVI
jgi:DNA-binding CsgD family transcriptional regulator